MKKHYKIHFLILIIGVFINTPIWAQDIKVTGKVTDAADGSALPGVTIIEQGTTTGTVTDLDGNYTITVGENAVLAFSFVGYETISKEVGNESVINVNLYPDIQQLNELVVVGYGTQEKSDVTGVVEEVSANDFNRGAIISPDQLITGKIAGVQITQNSGEPGGQTSIRIRGGTSIGVGGASNDPLFVIDGVPIDNSAFSPGGFSQGRNPLNFLDPNDIETFTVLKDASAAAIYGSRGANGVIIITTKKGKAGSEGSVSYNGYYSVAEIANELEILNAEQYRNVITAKAPERLGNLGNSNTNWYDQILQRGHGQSHSISFSGGSENVGYRASIGHQDIEGIVKTSFTKRTNLSLNYNHSLFDNKLSINGNFKGSYTKDRFDPGVVGGATAFDPTRPVYDPSNEEFGGYFEYSDPLAVDNPVSVINQTEDFGETYRSLGNIELEYKPDFLAGLSAKLNLGYDVANGQRKRFQASTTAAQLTNKGEIRFENSHRRNVLLETYLNYKINLESIRSDIDFTAGYSYQDWSNEYPGFQATQLSTNVLGSNNPDPASESIPYNAVEENRLISFFGRMNYSFGNKYLLTLTMRRDGSSRFGPLNKWGTFPSAAIGWRVLNEEFAQGLTNIFHDLKLRASYGIVGSQEIGNYRYLATYSYGDSKAQYQFGDGFVSTLRPNGYDLDLKWEETSSYNIGLDFGVLKGRLNGSVEYYYKHTKDLLFEVAVPAGANLTNIILTNIGEMENKGVELSLDAIAIDKTDFSWNIGVNAAFNKNEILKLDQGEDPAFEGYQIGGISGGVGNNIQILKVGESVNSFYVYKHKLNENGDPLADGIDHNGDEVINLADIYEDTNGDEVVNDRDRRIFEKSAPDVTLGLSSSARYKGFDLTFTLRASLGNYVYNNNASNNGYYNRVREAAPYNLHSSVLVNDFTTPQFFSDVYVEDASFLRMDNLTLGYTIPKFSEKLNLRVYGTAQNLFVLTDYNGIDPEVFSGIDNNLYPRSRTFIIGVNLDL